MRNKGCNKRGIKPAARASFIAAAGASLGGVIMYLWSTSDSGAAREAVLKRTREVGLDAAYVYGLIRQESRFIMDARSGVGASGLMQIMPFWPAELNEPDANLFDIHTNLRMGCTILKYYLDKENGRLSPALARYNGSYGKTWYPSLVYASLDKTWFQM